MSANLADVLLEEAAAFIAVAESGDAEQSAYEQAALKLEEAMRKNPALTHQEIADKLGKNRSYVTRLLGALVRARAQGKPFRVDWGSGSNQRKKVLEQAEPEALIEALHHKIEEAPSEQRDKLVEAVTNPATVGGRHITNEVVEREQAAKKKQAEKKEEPLTGIPLPMLWASMCVTVDEWVRELSVMEDEDLSALEDGNPDGAEKVAQVFDRLDVQTQRYRRLLRGRPDLRVIENDGVIDVVAHVP